MQAEVPAGSDETRAGWEGADLAGRLLASGATAGNPQMACELLAAAVRRDLLLLVSMALWLPALPA